MSGWIKFWKDMPNDPRVLAAALKLSKRYILAERTPGGGVDMSSNALCNAWRNAVTGALATLWCYADEHIREDDTLPLTSQTLDAIVGIEGFFDAIPREWIDELDDGTLILPGYSKKNSLIAKRKRTIKSNARVTQWRRAKQANGNGVTSNHVTQCNAAGDLDQDIDLRPLRKIHVERDPNFERISKAYPKFDGRQNWGAAEHHWRLRLEEGLSENDLVASVERYARFVAAGGVSAPRFVMTPATFFSAADKPWLQPWTPPATKAEAAQDANVSASKAWLEGSNAAQ